MIFKNKISKKEFNAKIIIRKQTKILFVVLLLFFCIWFFDLISVGKIQGRSMEPTFFAGDIVIYEKISIILGRLKKSDIVIINGDTISQSHRLVINFKKDEFLIKRIQIIFKEKTGFKYYVVGDNKDDSVDSRDFGAVEEKDVKGRVILIWRKGG